MDAQQLIEWVNELVEGSEGAYIQIIGDDPFYEHKESQNCLAVCGEYTDFNVVHIYGESWVDCVRKAVELKDEWYREKPLIEKNEF